MRKFGAVVSMLAFLSVLAACGGRGEGDPPLVPAAPGDVPAQRQVPPPPGIEHLTDDQVAHLVSTATADDQVATAIRQGAVAEVTVQAIGAEAGVLAFLFRAPVRPASVPWDVMCDIAGQTDEWRGVAALVDSHSEVEGSPIWLTGANCVGWQEPG